MPESESDVNASGAASPVRQVDLTRKELRETLRDRRTILTLLAMPVLLYPLLGVGFRFVAWQQLAEDAPAYRLVVASPAKADWLKNRFRGVIPFLDEGELFEPAYGEDQNPTPDANSPTSAKSGPRLELLTPDSPENFDMEEVVRLGEADLGIKIDFGEPDGPVGVTLIDREGSAHSREAKHLVQKRLLLFNQRVLIETIQQVDPEAQLPINTAVNSVVPEAAPSAILGLLPLVLLLMTVTGAVYPAIDLTAGERERETLETLMAMPVARGRLLLAKFVAVMAVTLLTGLMNLLAMTLTVYALGLEPLIFGESGLTVGLVLKLLAVLFVFALFFSSVLLVITSSARSFKEAQAYLIPLLLLSIAPGMVILLPGWELNTLTAGVPLVNMLLLARDLFEGTADPVPTLLAVGSTLLYAFAALSVAARLFGADAFSVGSRGQWGDLFSRPEEQSAVATPSVALTTIALLFPLFFVASGLSGRGAEIDMFVRLVTSGLLTALLFAGLPIAVLLYRRVRLPSGLALHTPRSSHVVAAILLGLSTWPFVFEITLLLSRSGFGNFGESQQEQVEQILAAWQSLPLAAILIAYGVLPGVCEEICFRGFLLNSLRKRTGDVVAILLSGLAFGFFHVVLSGGVAPERVVPSTLMGLLLGWVFCRTNSVLPGMALHVLHNSTLLTIARYRDELKGYGVGQVAQEHLPLTWLLGAGMLFTVGAGWLMVRRGARDHES